MRFDPIAPTSADTHPRAVPAARSATTRGNVLWGVLVFGVLIAVGWAFWARLKSRIPTKQPAAAAAVNIPTVPVPASAPGSAQPGAAATAPAPAPAVNAVAPPTDKAAARKALADQFAQDHPQLQRYHHTVKSASARNAEAEALVQGRTPYVTRGKPEHADLLRWLFLDPPEKPEVRLMVTKVAVRSLSAGDLVQLLEVCHYAGSPNLQEVRECASWMLDLNVVESTDVLKQRLKPLTEAPGKE